MRYFLIIVFNLGCLIINGQVDQKAHDSKYQVDLENDNKYNNYPCKDSTFIFLNWWGDVDKPYKGLVFHNKQSCYPNPKKFFLTPFEVSESQFSSLIAIIKNDIKVPIENFNRVIYYSFAYYNNDSILNVMTVMDDKELLDLAIKTLAIFEGSPQFNLVLDGWKGVLSRFNLSIPADTKE